MQTTDRSHRLPLRPLEGPQGRAPPGGIASEQVCRQRDCVTLETVHQLELDVVSHDCNSEAGKLLDGRLGSAQLVHKFMDGDGNNRGVHEGPFRWRAPDLLATGMMKGVTNVGTHRRPAFDDCQTCKDTGVMEGMLLGTHRPRQEQAACSAASCAPPTGCASTPPRAAARAPWPARSKGRSSATAASGRSAPASTSPRSPTGSGPNPRVEQGVSFTVHDFAGSARPPTRRIQTMGALHRARRGLPDRDRPAGALQRGRGDAGAPSPRPPSFEAFEAGGASAGALTMTVGQSVAGDAAHHRHRDRPRGDHRPAERDAAAALLLRAGRLAAPLRARRTRARSAAALAAGRAASSRHRRRSLAKAVDP